MKTRFLFIAAVLALFTLCLPGSGGATGKLIAAIMSSDQPRYREAHRAFVRSLADRGYPPSTVEILLQIPNPDPLSWSNTIRKFNAYKPDLIVAYGAPAASAAMKEANDMPVVAADAYLPEHPIKGMSGVSSRVPMVTLVKTLQDIRPFRRLGIIYTGREIGSQRQRDEIRKLALQYGVTVAELNVSSGTTLDNGLTGLFERSDAVIATESSVVCRAMDRIITRAKSRNIPVAATIPDSAEKGAVVSLEISPQEQGHLAAEIAVRLLEGASPDRLTMLTPRRVDLIINMKTARELGLNLPFPVLGAATRVLK
jgi:putative ABC transport system substrate-binding protein